MEAESSMIIFLRVRGVRVYAFDFAVTVRARAPPQQIEKKKSEIEKSQLTLREKVGFEIWSRNAREARKF